MERNGRKVSEILKACALYFHNKYLKAKKLKFKMSMTAKQQQQQPVTKSKKLFIRSKRHEVRK